MKALHRKLFRDLRHLRGQAVAVGLIVASGIASFVTARSAFDSLWASHVAYYRDYRFASVFASLERAPRALTSRIASIPGVQAVEPRVVLGVTLDVPGLDDVASARLISIPENGQPSLNRLYVRRGRFLDASHPDEILVSEAFADANGLQPGDALGVLIAGRWQRARIAGIALSPEFIFDLPEGSLLPDKRRFGTLWMSERNVARAFDMEGAFNDICLGLGPGASERAVITELDALLDRYGGLGAYGRADHPSHARFTQEFDELRAWGKLMPVIFLGVAAFLLQIVTTRLVAGQRDQIAVIKAFGYTNGAVARHYLALVLVIVAAGGAVGVAAGWGLSGGLLRTYESFFRFPSMRHEVSLELVLGGLGISLLAAAAGAVGAVRSAVRLPPAEAMRPEAPARFRASWLERVGLTRITSPPARILLRNLARRPLRLALSVLSIALAVTVLIVARYFSDAIDLVMDGYFRNADRAQATVAFNRGVDVRVRYDLARLPGVRRVEPLRLVPVRLRAKDRVERTAILGVGADAELRRISGESRRPTAASPSGLILTSWLATRLGLRVGDLVTVEILEGRRLKVDLRVEGEVDELLGAWAYLELGALNRLLGEGAATGAALALDPLERDAFNAALKGAPAVAGVSMREAVLASYRESIAEVFGVFTAVLILLAMVVAGGVVYNGARIALFERGRELASLRVLGFTRGEVAAMLMGEQAVILLLGVPVGIGLGYGLSALIAQAYQNELIRLPLVITGASCAFSLIVVLAAGLLSGALVKRRADRLDLVAVLKTRE